MAKSDKSASASGKIAEQSARMAPPPPPADGVSDVYAEPQADGGETHQIAGGDVATLTTAQGIPVADNQNSLKQGARGPTLLEEEQKYNLQGPPTSVFKTDMHSFS